ncbi:MAG: hypothetical protein R3E86_20930 [Pseudomonadales bacterium]
MNDAASDTGPLEALLADAVERLANAGVELDPATAARLHALEGRSVQLRVQLPAPVRERVFSLRIQAGRPRLDAVPVPQPNVIVSGTPVDLAAWLLAPGSGAAARLRVDGDGTVVHEFSGILHGYAPDFSAPLGRLFGEATAANLIGFGELALAAARSVLAGAGSALREGAGRHFASKAEIDDFLDRLDALRLRVDRLDARMRIQAERRQTP